MGRQHTTWISEENWQKLTNIPGESTSSRIGYAIKHVDPDHQMWVNAKMRQLEQAKSALRQIARVSKDENERPNFKLEFIEELIEEFEWLWEASV